MKKSLIILLAAGLLASIVGCVKTKPTYSVTPGDIVAETREESEKTVSEKAETATPSNLEEAYKTEPGIAPNPIDPDSVEITDNVCHMTLSIRCTDLLSDADLLKEEKLELVPEDGYILFAEEVEFHEGETLFAVLLREMSERKIHLSFDGSAKTSAFVEDIGNLYNGDAGAMSGWLYFVNGVNPPYSASVYGLHDGDRAEFAFVTDFNRYF